MDETTRTLLWVLVGCGAAGGAGAILGALLYRASSAFGQGIKQVQERAEWE